MIEVVDLPLVQEVSLNLILFLLEILQLISNLHAWTNQPLLKKRMELQNIQ